MAYCHVDEDGMQDEQGVRQIVTRLEQAWNNSDCATWIAGAPGLPTIPATGHAVVAPARPGSPITSDKKCRGPAGVVPQSQTAPGRLM